MRLWYTSSSVGGQYAFMVYQKNKTCAINAYWGTRPIIPQKSINYACKGPWETHNPHQALMAVQTLASFSPEIAQLSKKSKWLTKVTFFFGVEFFFDKSDGGSSQEIRFMKNKPPRLFTTKGLNMLWTSLNKVRQFSSSASPKVTTSALPDSNTK